MRPRSRPQAFTECHLSLNTTYSGGLGVAVACCPRAPACNAEVLMSRKKSVPFVAGGLALLALLAADAANSVVPAQEPAARICGAAQFMAVGGRSTTERQCC